MNVEDHAQIADLVKLAQEKNAKSRRLLVENISDLFLTPDGRLNDHERALMSDILCKLIENIETSVRRELAERLSSNNQAPPDLILMLANDQISIARPILERSPVLQDPDLVEIVRNRSKEHRLSIAIREDINPDVSDALIEHGDTDVIDALLKNPDAELSDRSMEYLVAESRRIDRFQEPLLRHCDLPLKLAHRMFWWVSAALRHHILLSYEATEHELDAAIETATNQALINSKPADGIESKSHQLVARLHAKGELTVAFIIQSLRQRRIPVFIAGLAEMGHIDYRTVANILSDAGGECLAVLCKAVGVERSDFTSIFLLLEQAQGGGNPLDPGILTRNLELFDSTKQENAMAALGYWQRDSNYQDAIEDVEEAQKERR